MRIATQKKASWRPIPLRRIRAFAQQIAQRFHPERIILFGSYAYGKPTYDSDVDLLVIMDAPLREVDQATEIRLALDAPFPLDLMVRRPKTIEHRIALGDYFLQEVTAWGKVLYAKTAFQTARDIRSLVRKILCPPRPRARKRNPRRAPRRK
jgi:predicted nucleotidyltransferase